MVDGIRPSLTKVAALDRRAATEARRTGGLDRLGAARSRDQPTAHDAAVEQDENDVTSINYTSGTTARPKGVMLTHRNCYINAYNFIAHLRIQHEDVELWTLPMFHANGWGGPFAHHGDGRDACRACAPSSARTSTGSSRTRA